MLFATDCWENGGGDYWVLWYAMPLCDGYNRDMQLHEGLNIR